MFARIFTGLCMLQAFVYADYPYSYDIPATERKQIFDEIVERDLKVLSDNDLAWLAQQAMPLDRIGDKELEYDKILDKIFSIAKKVKKPADFGKKEEHEEKNFHSSAIPYDETRTLREKKDFYISASDIFSPEQMYIVSQAPLEKTVLDFWTTIVETNTNTIVALAMPEEDPLYARYFSKERFPMEGEGWKICFLGEKIVETSASIPNERIVERTFTVINGEKSRLITQLHYENWPDFGAPAIDLFHKLLVRTGSKVSGSIVVHCAAGQGRSGTFVTADSIVKDLRKSLFVNIPKRIVELRMQRKGLVSTPVQLEAIYRVVATFRSSDV